MCGRFRNRLPQLIEGLPEVGLCRLLGQARPEKSHQMFTPPGLVRLAGEINEQSLGGFGAEGWEKTAVMGRVECAKKGQGQELHFFVEIFRSQIQ